MPVALPSAPRHEALTTPFVSLQVLAPASGPLNERDIVEFSPALFFEISTRTIHTYLLDVYAPEMAGIRRRRFRGGLSVAHLRHAKAMLSVRDHDSVTLTKLAAACGLSPSHFSREFKKTTGYPPHQWALRNKVSLAKEMMLQTPLSLTEIADACGFVDHSHLSRWFKRVTGVNPKTWQRSHQIVEYDRLFRSPRSTGALTSGHAG